MDPRIKVIKRADRENEKQRRSSPTPRAPSDEDKERAAVDTVSGWIDDLREHQEESNRKARLEREESRALVS